MTGLHEDVESEKQKDPWRRKATTTARFELCYQCKYYSSQKPYKPGVRCRFGLRPEVIFGKDKAIAKCDVFIAKIT